jgi:DNA-binding CsgD family transcriptional regulator
VNSSNCNILSSGCIDFDRETAGRGHSSGRPALRRPSRYRMRSSGDIKIAPARPKAGAATPQQKEATRRRADGATLQELADSYDRSISTMRRATRAA